jgi:CBS domain-containing protein
MNEAAGSHQVDRREESFVAMKVYAKDIMQRDVRTVDSDLPLAELQLRFAQERVSGYPVVEGSSIQGVVSERDLLRPTGEVCDWKPTAFYQDGPDTPARAVESSEKRSADLRVRDVMSTKVVSVTPDTALHDVAALMSDKQIHRVLVVEENRLVGMISSLDIVRACGQDSIEISFSAPKIQDF